MPPIVLRRRASYSCPACHKGHCPADAASGPAAHDLTPGAEQVVSLTGAVSYERVAAYLAALELASFDPKAPPPKTEAFWAIVDANAAPEDAELADVLDKLGNPPAVTLADVQNNAPSDFEQWLRDRKNRRQIPYRFERCGYIPVRNDVAKDGLWTVKRVRQVIYARAELTARARREVAAKRAGQ